MAELSSAASGSGSAPRIDASQSSRLLEAEDVAEYLGMRTDWVYREVRAGRLPHIRLGAPSDSGASPSRRGWSRVNADHRNAAADETAG